MSKSSLRLSNRMNGEESEWDRVSESEGEGGSGREGEGGEGVGGRERKGARREGEERGGREEGEETSPHHC